MSLDIFKTVREFKDQLASDKNHRYLSWEHCYGYFERDAKYIDEDTACLHLAFYLASWGMYRGSSFLLWKDYLIHKDVVKDLLKMRHLRSFSLADSSDTDINEIITLCKLIRARYAEIDGVNGKEKKVEATDTLVTKIVLGVLGCVPAYDRYFIDGLRKERIGPHKPSADGLNAVVVFYRQNQDAFDQLHNQIKTKSGEAYPVMKLIDMYFWQIGFNQDMEKASKQ